MLEVHRARILLAEDNPGDVLMIQEALAEHGVDCELLVMNDGEEAIRFIEQSEADAHAPIDLLLLDLHLPKRDGGEILRRLRASEQLKETPVIVLSGSESPGDLATAQKYNARHFLKPGQLAAFMQIGAIAKDALKRGQQTGGGYRHVV